VIYGTYSGIEESEESEESEDLFLSEEVWSAEVRRADIPLAGQA